MTQISQMPDRQPPWLARHGHRLAVHLLALAPLLLPVWWLVADAWPVTGALTLLRWSGLLGLALVLAALACTPLIALSGWRGWHALRRPLGVYGFCYALAHLLVYASSDAGFDMELIARDLGERRAMLVGMLALLALAPLALTSTNGWQRRLGARWRQLHRLVYLAALLSVLHYLLLERDLNTGAWVALGALALLLLLRVPALRRVMAQRPNR